MSSPNILLSDNNLLSDEIELNIFPNPTTDFINLSFKSNSDYRWVMYNELGSIVNQSRTKKSNGKTVELINTSDLKSGIYFMSIIIDGNAITKEFLIN